jgi:hypothetical protein
MVKKIIVCVLVVFFADSFLACSCNLFAKCSSEEVKKPKDEPLNLVTLDHDAWTQVTDGKPFQWKNEDGFFPNENHIYGFDRHTEPKSGSSEDSIVYISVLKGDSVTVTLKINQEYGSSLKHYDYYICKHTQLDKSIGYIDTSKTKLQYTFTPKDSVEIIALCKKSDVGYQKVQELHINSYNWKTYDFYVYILGDEKNMSERHQLLNSIKFWSLYDSVFGQAIVKYGKLQGEFKTIDRGYILTIAENKNKSTCGYYDFINYMDIGKAFRYVYDNAKAGGQRRNIIQIGYPTKRFWPLMYDENSNIQICGEFDPSLDPTLNPNQFDLELEILPDSKCSKAEVSIIRDKNINVWKLKYKDGRPDEIATKNNIKKDCMVFADARLGDYVGEVKGVLAITEPRLIASIVIQPWLDSATTKTALHELGHTMGLFDLLQEPPSYNNESNNEQNNVMIQGGPTKSLHLRKRGIMTIDVTYFGITNKGGLEYQWDCLHKEPKACKMSILDPGQP